MIWIFYAPVTAGIVGARDGNDSAHRKAVSGSIIGLNIAPGTSFWLRWQDFDATNADDGLAVDDFSLTAWGATSSNPVSDPGKTFPLGLLGLAFLGVWFRSQGCAYAG